MNSRIYYIIRACKFLKYSNVNVVINFDTFHRGRIIWDNAMAFNWTTTLTRSKANWDRPMCASVWIDPEIQALFISNLPWTIVITRAIGFRSRDKTGSDQNLYRSSERRVGDGIDVISNNLGLPTLVI